MINFTKNPPKIGDLVHFTGSELFSSIDGDYIIYALTTNNESTNFTESFYKKWINGNTELNAYYENILRNNNNDFKVYVLKPINRDPYYVVTGEKSKDNSEFIAEWQLNSSYCFYLKEYYKGYMTLDLGIFSEKLDELKTEELDSYLELAMTRFSSEYIRPGEPSYTKCVMEDVDLEEYKNTFNAHYNAIIKAEQDESLNLTLLKKAIASQQEYLERQQASYNAKKELMNNVGTNIKNTIFGLNNSIKKYNTEKNDIKSDISSLRVVLNTYFNDTSNNDLKQSVLNKLTDIEQKLNLNFGETILDPNLALIIKDLPETTDSNP